MGEIGHKTHSGVQNTHHPRVSHKTPEGYVRGLF